METVTRKQVLNAIKATAEMCGFSLSDVAVEGFVYTLKEAGIPGETIILTLSRIARTHRGRFTVADIIDAARGPDDHPSADTAWAIAVKFMTTEDSAIVTNQITEACAVARDLLDMGDKFGARKAFVERYKNLVMTEVERGRKPAWRVSIGDSKDDVPAVVKEAVACGQIVRDQAIALLPFDCMDARHELETGKPLTAIEHNASNALAAIAFDATKHATGKTVAIKNIESIKQRLKTSSGKENEK